MTRRLRGGGLAAWAIDHPIGVSMIGLALVVVGLFAFWRLAVDLLPQVIYPTVRVRILDPGVSAKIMEDQVTRQLEEQLAITEDAVGLESRTSEGNSTVDLSFQYGKDMDLALRDASTRLDRAKRFLPDTIDPPVIYKRDPSQIPVAEFVVTSSVRDPVALRDWSDYVFSRWFINLPGVAAAEVGGGLVREIQVIPDPWRLAALGLSTSDLSDALKEANVEQAAGRLYGATREYVGRTAARFTSLEEIRRLPLAVGERQIPLGDVAQVVDTHEDERIRIRLDGEPGVKVTIQKQPTANTVAVVDGVKQRLAWLRGEGFIPDDIEVQTVHDQSVYVRNALNNATAAAATGALLAMLVVYIFLGNLRRTLIVGTAIPLSIVVAFMLMDAAGLTLNIMTLGGLAVGIGMVVDSTIVMLENIYRHQREGEQPALAGANAAAEVNSAIVASTSTNLAAIVPFLFIGGLVGLLFRELIFTVSAAIVAAMLVSLTLVPALAARVPAADSEGRTRRFIDKVMGRLQRGYTAILGALLDRGLAQVVLMVVMITAAVVSLPVFLSGKQTFLPHMDDGRVRVSVVADPGIALDEMDRDVRRLEALFAARPEVESVFTLAGGRIFGRTQRETSNRSTLDVQLKPLSERDMGSGQWVKQMQQVIDQQRLVGVKVRMRTGSIRGLRVGRGEDDISLRILGPDLETMDAIGFEMVKRLRGLPGIKNLVHSSEELVHELAVTVDRERAAAMGLTMDEVAEGVAVALDGVVATDFIDGDRSYDVRLRLPRGESETVQRLEGLLIAPGRGGQRPVHLADLAQVTLVPSPAEILRDNQRRIVEVTASLDGEVVAGEVLAAVRGRLAELPMPAGYTVYEAGITEALQEGQALAGALLGLALFLVFVVMAVQYESLRDPVVILLSVPFAAIGVAAGLELTALPLSMPVWLGVIMLAGIVVNNAIVLVEYIDILRERGHQPREAIVEAARLRLRPILMTTLTTTVGLLPLALGLGEGAEMLQPLAVTIVFGLLFSMLVSLVLVPVLYLRLPQGRGRRQEAQPATV